MCTVRLVGTSSRIPGPLVSLSTRSAGGRAPCRPSAASSGAQVQSGGASVLLPTLGGDASSSLLCERLALSLLTPWRVHVCVCRGSGGGGSLWPLEAAVESLSPWVRWCILHLALSVKASAACTQGWDGGCPHGVGGVAWADILRDAAPGCDSVGLRWGLCLVHGLLGPRRPLERGCLKAAAG